LRYFDICRKKKKADFNKNGDSECQKLHNHRQPRLERANLAVYSVHRERQAAIIGEMHENYRISFKYIQYLSY
jgi:hypothetical protein